MTPSPSKAALRLAKNRRLSPVVAIGGGGNRTYAAILPTKLAANGLDQQQELRDVSGEYEEDGTCLKVTASDIELYEQLQLVVAAWQHLPSHLRQAILSIVSGGR